MNTKERKRQIDLQRKCYRNYFSESVTGIAACYMIYPYKAPCNLVFIPVKLRIEDHEYSADFREYRMVIKELYKVIKEELLRGNSYDAHFGKMTLMRYKPRRQRYNFTATVMRELENDDECHTVLDARRKVIHRLKREHWIKRLNVRLKGWFFALTWFHRSTRMSHFWRLRYYEIEYVKASDYFMENINSINYLPECPNRSLK